MSTTVILDDSQNPSFGEGIQYTGTQWVPQGDSNSAYNSTLTVCHTERKGTDPFSTPPSFRLVFWGSDIRIYGPLTNGVAFNYSIDSSSVRPGTINASGAGKNNIEIWSLQGLAKGTFHTLEVFPSAGLLSIDYITYTLNEFPEGNDLIVDNADPSIQYSSDWAHNDTSTFIGGPSYQGTLSGSRAKGSTLKFDFVGATIAVYGSLNQLDGKLSALFSVDGGDAVTYSPFDGTQASNPASWTLFQQFFRQDLVPGKHSLLISVGDVTGSQTLWVDSLVFEGTADTSFIPNLTDPSIATFLTHAVPTSAFTSISGSVGGNSNSLSRGDIAGLASSIPLGVLGLAISAFGVWYGMKRQKEGRPVVQTLVTDIHNVFHPRSPRSYPHSDQYGRP